MSLARVDSGKLKFFIEGDFISNEDYNYSEYDNFVRMSNRLFYKIITNL